MKVKISLSLDQVIIEKLKAEAVKDRRTVSQLVEIWLQDAITMKEALSAAEERAREV
jgi:hypothetical protein